jgi:5-methyltetrahydropteroyltriglutamate--homocysteine methyltransferase
VKHSEDRILTSHTGSMFLPPPDGDGPADPHQGAPALRLAAGSKEETANAVAALVHKQVEVGLDIINNGDVSIATALFDPARLLGGLERVPATDDRPGVVGYPDADMETYHEYYARSGFHEAMPPVAHVCTAPLSSTGQDKVDWDIATLKQATADQPVEGVFYDFISPGWLARLIYNEHYASEEEFVFALAESMKPYFTATVEAGLILQIDSPDIVDNWTWDRWDDVTKYRKHLEMRIEALTNALADCPQDQVRLHFCWGSWSGPHSGALPLEHVIDIVYRLPVGCISVEAAKPNHTHEWRVFKDHPLPDGCILMPGVIDHTTPIIEHPQVIADRLVTYAGVVGKENVIAGTDCGMRIDARVEWAKLKAMVDGASLASKELF